MKRFTFLRIFLLLIIFIVIYTYWGILSSYAHNNSLKNKTHNSIIHENANAKITRPRSIFVAVVACGDRLKESLNMLKSALMFTKVFINFIIVCEDKLALDFEEKLSEWKILSQTKFHYQILPLTFPKDNTKEWKELFKPCAAQRLFLPSLLTNIDSILYIDTDTLFLTSLETIWDHFYNMNATQMAALAPEHVDPNVGWYNRFARHPYYGPLGVNSGVMLMNLTKMREFKWTKYVVPIYKKYKLKITWGDQDIINIIFHYHSDKLYIYSCRYNFRPDLCMYTSVCKSAEEHGVAVLHGSRGYFHSENQPVFQAVYRAFEEYQLGDDLNKGFLMPLESYLESAAESNCGHVRYIFLKNVKKYINVHDNR